MSTLTDFSCLNQKNISSKYCESLGIPDLYTKVVTEPYKHTIEMMRHYLYSAECEPVLHESCYENCQLDLSIRNSISMLTSDVQHLEPILLYGLSGSKTSLPLKDLTITMAPEECQWIDESQFRIQQEEKDEVPEISPSSILEWIQYNEGSTPYNESKRNSPILQDCHSIENVLSLSGEPSKKGNILKAAKALYSKRTRTLFHWINPRVSKTKLKASVMTSWDSLPDWQKQIYISQVMGKFGANSVSPMVNPQIQGIKQRRCRAQNEMEEASKKRRCTNLNGFSNSKRKQGSDTDEEFCEDEDEDDKFKIFPCAADFSKYY